jgi:thiamine biosynthesis lipoprotein
MSTKTPAVDAVISPRRRQVMLGAAAGIGLAGCQRFTAGAADVARISGATMGGAYTVKLVAPEQDLAAVRSAVQGALDAVDWRMSLFRADSELAAFNRARLGEPFALSDEMHRVFAAALAVSRQTDGAFDMTVAPLVERWGFGTSPTRRVPSTTTLVEARARLGWQSLHLDEATRTVVKDRRDVQADLGGIAKGYGVDRVAATLDALGIGHYMVEVGGEVRTRGANGAGAPWQIGIEEPDALPQRARLVVPLSGRAMATSGDYRNYFEQDGRRFSHEIDPVTGAPIAHALCSVTVVADDCMRADALATALIVMGPRRGLALAEAEGIAALFIERTAPGQHRDRATAAFAALGARTVA